MNRYLSFNDYMLEKFHEKVLKLPLNMGFTCPNRDGTKGWGGCRFCSEKGAGDFTLGGDLFTQLDSSRSLLSKKWPNGLNLPYFQSFSSTYKDVKYLREIYYKALSYPNTIGIAIATRGDCMDEKVLDLLEEINNKTFLFVELGLQTTNDELLKSMNRGYDHKTFHETALRLKEGGIKTVCHVIFGLPGQGKKDMMDTVRYVSEMHFWGIKFHSFYLQEDSFWGKTMKMEEMKFLQMDEYIDLVIESIKILHKDQVIHRLTGDANREKLIGPSWVRDKLKVISSIEKELKVKNIHQADGLAK